MGTDMLVSQPNAIDSIHQTNTHGVACDSDKHEKGDTNEGDKT